MKNFKYYIFNKPYRVLSQFSSTENKKTLKEYLNLNKDIYPAGRLDYDSEGLLFLTNDGRLISRLLNPIYAHSRKYFVQVEGTATHEHLKKLKKGIVLNGRKTKELIVKIIEEPNLWARVPPIRYRKNIPTSWLELELFEGMNRQVRKMCATAGLPVLRLIRTEILCLNLNGLFPGDYRELNFSEINALKMKLNMDKVNG